MAAIATPAKPRLPASIVTKLNDPRDEIRLVKLLPGKGGDTIDCRYTIASLNNRPQYQTVSYVWGDATKTREIRLDGVECDISENLFAALSHIRLQGDAIVLWTDALCINQMDDIEKTHQVNIMHRIYQNCSNCFIWLGEITVNGDCGEFAIHAAKGAFDALQTIAGLLDDHLPPSLTSHEDRIQAGQGLEAMMQASWWSRIWTVQEACLPPQATILWGPLRLHWEVVDRAADNMLRGHWPSSISLWEIFPGGNTNPFTPAVVSLRSAREWVTDDVDLIDRIWRFHYRQATDSRDKIYGIMALMGNRALPSVPSCDYTLDAATLFKRVTLDLLREEHGLKPLIGWRGERRMTPGLPTWAFDLERPTSGRDMTARVWTHSHFLLQFTADRGLPMLDLDNLTSEDESLLYVDGFYVDRVAARGESFLEEDEAHGVTLTDLELNIEKWRQMVNDFTRTKLANHNVRGGLYEAAATGMRDAFDDLVGGGLLSDDMDLIEGVDPRIVWKREMCKIQAFFITESGYIGLGPPTIEVGDEVWVLSGGRTPFVLRACDDSAPVGESDQYQFVGDTYVYGIMWGEAVVGREDKHRTVTMQ
ncbi:heterokaryon incompatibility protein-domain-containing protein [Xylariales sp. AK1849]|nr:heterokaryon incompatibility protein-domain-containing protein [Xylariales sp. AK1849]